MAAIQHEVIDQHLLYSPWQVPSSWEVKASTTCVQCSALGDACDAHPGYANHVVSATDQIVGQTGAILARKLGHIGDTDLISLLAAASSSSWAAGHDISGVAGMACREGEWNEVEEA